MGIYQSGQMGQTVNLLFRLRRFESSCPHRVTMVVALLESISESSSIGRAPAFQAGGCGFETRLSLLFGRVVKLMNNRINGQKTERTCVGGLNSFEGPQKEGLFVYT